MNILENDYILISYWQLISNVSKIEIPIIQRDFVQGRESVKTTKIRNQFLSSLLNALEVDNEILELDFIYGNYENKIFQPLDGQQRLTTLFLLHWYIALKTGNLEQNKGDLSKFTYETRISSREFCQELVQYGDRLGNGDLISDKIADSKWFFITWKKDLTIKAMLTMLNSIEDKFKDKSIDELKQFWQKLTNDDAPICFQFKKINNIGLTDDLYIKMNARGKELSDFENFKAQFEKHIKGGNSNHIDWEGSQQSNPTNTFSHKIDTIWTDLFWKYRGEDNLIDNELIKFIAGMAISNYAKDQLITYDAEEVEAIKVYLSKKNNVKITDEAVKRERIERRIAALYNNPFDVSPIDFPSQISFEELKECLDVYTKNNFDEVRPNNLILWDYCINEPVKINSFKEINNNLFYVFVKEGKTEYKQRVLFFAQTQYLKSVTYFNLDLFSNWMRVVRNIVHNATIDSATTFMGAIGLINEISNGCDNIYHFLLNNKVKSSFAADEVAEEILKSPFILKNSVFCNSIFNIEDTNFFKGKIKFALNCVSFDNLNKELNSNMLDSICLLITTHFSSSDFSNEIRRALFTVRDHHFYNYWSTWSYGTDSDKKCLVESTNDLRNKFTNGYWSEYFKELLLLMINNPLDNILNDFKAPEGMPNWKVRIIKEPKLLENYCQSHYIGIPQDNNSCFLFCNKKRPSSRQECKIVI